MGVRTSPRPAALPLLLLVTALAHGWTTHAQEAAPQIELSPAALELPSRGEAHSQLTLRNRSKSTLRDVKLDWFTDTGANVAAEDQGGLPSLAPQAETFWVLKVSEGDGGLVPGSVFFRISYNVVGKKEPHVLTAALQLSSRQTDDLGKVVDVAADTSSTLLNEQRPGQVFIVISNKSSQPLRVGEITTIGPSFITGNADTSGLQKDASGKAVIAPHDSGYVPVLLKVRDAVTPGKHMLLFSVPVEWGERGKETRVGLITQKEFDVGIMAESEILTALGLPSFLILPGFLIIVTFRLLSRRTSEESLLKMASNPALWVSAITLSGIMAYLYPLGTKLIGGVSRDYLYGYGLGDIVRVWLASILIGMAAWVLWRGLARLWRRLFKPSEEDSPEELLKKLFWQWLSLRLYEFDVRVGGQDRKLYLLERRRDNQETLWVGPSIRVVWQPTAPTDFQKRFEQTLQDGGTYRMARLISKGKRKDWLTASWWEPAGVLTHPFAAKKAAVTRDRGTKGNIVMVGD
jgi:hypothetical protein